jgi:solute carrier family 25 carnitine/acylcarnitine transporter 20/29
VQTQYSHLRSRVSNWQCVRDVYGKNGLRGLYRGLGPTAGREMLGNTTYFMAYESAKEFLLDKLVGDDRSDSDRSAAAIENASFHTYQAIAVAGGYAGFMYWLVVFPVDTVKSVIQADRLDRPQYKGVLDCCRQLYKEGGPARFYRGISPSLIRAFPANAITFVAFETCLSFLDQHF